MQCPGQDTRYWKPDDIFDIPCQACGTPVEFFKNDARRRCPKCGARLQNPKISLGCAQWCAHAKECLGFDPKALELAESGELSLADRLTAAVKAELGEAVERLTHLLAVLDEAQDLRRREGGDPRLVMAAALLHEAGSRPPVTPGAAGPEESGGDRARVIRRLLTELGFEATAVDDVCTVVAEVQEQGGPGTIEGRVVRDADRLARMVAEAGLSGHGALPDGEAGGWWTAAGSEKAGALAAARRAGREAPNPAR